jgi:hypothetical protein
MPPPPLPRLLATELRIGCGSRGHVGGALTGRTVALRAAAAASRASGERRSTGGAAKERAAARPGAVSRMGCAIAAGATIAAVARTARSVRVKVMPVLLWIGDRSSVRRAGAARIVRPRMIFCFAQPSASAAASCSRELMSSFW